MSTNERSTKILSNTDYDYGRRVHFGFAFDFGVLDYNITSSKTAHGNTRPEDNRQYTYFVDMSTPSFAWGVTALMDVRINYSFSFRMQLGPMFGARKITFFDLNQDVQRTMLVESVLLDMPLLLKYKALRHSDLRPYLIAGIIPYVDVSSFRKFNEDKGVYIGTNAFDIAATAGFGVDLYFNFFKLSIEGKYVNGFVNNISKKALVGYEQYPAAIDKAYARYFVFSLVFE
ncbi:hypothetical protein AGMMS4956_09110 [Bacteroidia bacterium]|nr:hypothetical protein AGMMS4956_09110 [Bacteroidia bacterium]